MLSASYDIELNFRMNATLEQQQQIEKEIGEELLNGETLLWSGQPLRQIIFHPSDWWAIPFSLLWGGFAIFWEWGATGHFGSENAKDGFSIFMALWGIPFIVVGQYMIWGRFLYTAWKKGRTYYGVTTKRVLVVNSGATRKVVSSQLCNLESISLTTRQDGTGTLDFSPEPLVATSFWNSRRSTGSSQFYPDLSRLAFYDVADARSIYGLIQKARSAAQGVDPNAGSRALAESS
ncbi:hypothetical protein [Terriglobus aquaticus]|uniref:PH domain-containing protein n=1 Tax=Terriglobus aquaticus TaxID=940139 RepID=A0ABW9KNN3_9BACT|nr:hypothetical protein [Terriglobus aquaticus]